jgi:hypothetical protein
MSQCWMWTKTPYEKVASTDSVATPPRPRPSPQLVLKPLVACKPLLQKFEHGLGGVHRDELPALRKQDFGEAAAAWPELEQDVARTEIRREDDAVEVREDLVRADDVDSDHVGLVPFLPEPGALPMALGVCLPSLGHGGRLILGRRRRPGSAQATQASRGVILDQLQSASRRRRREPHGG